MKFACKSVAIYIFDRVEKDLNDYKCELRKYKFILNAYKLDF